MATYLDDGKPIAIDLVRHRAARCCDETARYERGERGPLRLDGSILSEFDDAAAGVAAEVALAVGRALKSAGLPFRAFIPWETAASLLRGGWQRGHRIEPHVVGEGAN